MQTTTTAETRVSSFGVDEDVSTPTSLRIFGGAFVFLWLGMLALVYVSRRKQLALKAKLTAAEAAVLGRG